MAYATASDVRAICDLTTDDISDDDLNTIIEKATAIANADILVYVHEETVEYIDSERENDIDGENTTFYTKHKPLGDRNDDGTVDTSDIEVYYFDSEGNRTTATVISVDAALGKFVVQTAPESNYTVKVSYCYAPVDVNVGTPHALFKLAVTYLAAALAYSKIKPDQITRWTVDRITMVKQETPFRHYYNLYKEQIRRLLARVPYKKEGVDAANPLTGIIKS